MARLGANFGYKVLALAIAIFLWGVAHGSSSIERGFDVPVVLRGVPQELVITGQSADAVNVRVMGTRAALRNLSPENLEYTLDVASAKPGVSDFEVDLSTLDFPRGANVVARSPARIEIKFEGRGTKALRVKPEVTGEPAPGFEVTHVEVDPPRLRASGARSELNRLVELSTDAVDIAGARESFERPAHVQIGGTHVRLDDAPEVTVRVTIAEKAPPPAPAPAPAPPRQRPGRRG
jgi:YbbR domain-containing protein